MHSLDRVPRPVGWVGRTSRTAVVLAAVLFGMPRRTLATPPSLPSAADRALRERVEYGYNVGIVVGMVNASGRTIRGYGQRNVDSEGTVDGDTVFEIGSITKVFTSLLLADAAERGEVDLDDPVQRYLPEDVRVPRGTTEIRLRHLAIHRSGLPANPDNLCSRGLRQPFACYDLDRLHAFLNGYTLPREPGAAWEYSNLGVGLLGHALSRRAGVTYGDLVRERVLGPLGLRSTDEIPPADAAARVATGYSGVVEVPPFRMPALEGAGVLRSTVHDLLAFVACQLGLQESGLGAAMRATQLRQEGTGQAGVAMGLGWLRIDLPGGTVLQHDGATPGFSAFLGMHPTRRLGVVILSNARVNAYAGIADVGFHLLDAAYPLTALARPAVVPLPVLHQYTGWFQSSSGDVFELGLERGRLLMFHPASDFEFTLYPQSTTRFGGLDIELGGNASANFRTDAQGQVTRLDWTQAGKTTAYERRGDAARLELASREGQWFVSLRGGTGSFHIEGSSDLRQWQRLGTLATDSEFLPDPDARNGVARFYRARRQRGWQEPD